MQHFIQRLIDRRKDEDGASAVEYGLLVAAIAALIVIIVFALGGIVKEVFTDTCTDHQRRLRHVDLQHLRLIPQPPCSGRGPETCGLLPSGMNAARAPSSTDSSPWPSLL